MTQVRGMIVYRRWDQEVGLTEDEQPFSSLAELFMLCVHEPQLIDRLALAGPDEKGIARTVTFIFQTITAGDLPSE